ncbi:MAG: hypothetical protein Q7T33_15375 [Dehalococcoidia bacterium]|nr:hypothetical protein [Dehalococcoidia bacterium]
MLSFLADELVWAVGREREEEARRIHPHTDKRPQRERPAAPPADWGHWISLALSGGAPPARTCR